MKKIFTGKELLDFLHSFSWGFFCKDPADYNGVYLRIDPRRFKLYEKNGVSRLEYNAEWNGWKMAGCTFYGTYFKCDLKESLLETTAVITSDVCNTSVTTVLRKF